MNSIFSKFGFFCEKNKERFFCLFESILIVKNLLFAKSLIDEESFPKENNTSGGSRDKELNELTVLPIVSSPFFTQITVYL